MPNKRNPRSGSMQYWPRSRAKRAYARLRSHPRVKKETKLCGFAGYKVGMTHVLYNDQHKTSRTKGMDVSVPVTIIECPPLKVYGVRFYNSDDLGNQKVVGESVAKINDKNLKRKVRVPKKETQLNVPEHNDLRLLVYTQPGMTGIGKKKPEIFELAVSGSLEDQLAFAKEHFGKEIKLTDVISSGDVVDIHSITKGKGTQGPVKRFGISIRAKKSEKTKRGPGSISGGWKAQGHMMYRNPFSGQTGFQQRIDYNKWVLDVSNDFSRVNPAGGFVRYGLVKNDYVLVKGSVPGPSKRLIQMTFGVRPTKIPLSAPALKQISVISRQK
ncbi:MAG: 50S ribosomal protein L3 [Candidatus Woesearchaeota archaeon]